MIERNEAKEWLTKNVVGKPLDFSLQVGEVTFEETEGGKYNVDLGFVTNLDTMETKNLQGNLTIGYIEVGGVPCEVQAWGPAPAPAAPPVRATKGRHSR